jgi:anti-anti-sigma factor
VENGPELGPIARFEARDEGDVGVLRVEGELDTYASPELATRCDSLLAKASQIVLELDGITFIDSSGLRVLLSVDANARLAGRALALREPSAAVMRLLEITGLEDHFSINS